MEGRGRNGWFKVGHFGLWKLSDGTAQMEVLSRRHGGVAPIIIFGTVDEMESFLRKSLLMLDLVKGGAVHAEEELESGDSQRIGTGSNCGPCPEAKPVAD